ncbi:MAG TPA: Calx-beta domain-containing protein, partial [Steroidobacteraceae bacterium]|nr:Calx-beta domain-containing protein [Steroidobacteraceae bacterium]
MLTRFGMVALALMIAGCGGGGDDAEPPPPLPAGNVVLSDSAYSVPQSSELLTVTVNRVAGTRDSTVAYATTDGSAIAGTDYTARTGTLTWAHGDGAAKTISLPISNA